MTPIGPYADRSLVCSSCRVRFLWTAAQQRESAAQNPVVQPPSLCPGCWALRNLTTRQRGVVRWYDPRKGYGVIRNQDGEDVFVHRSALSREGGGRLRAGQQVEYQVEQTEKGSVAQEVIVVQG